MDDLMARTIVENLRYGINPITGEALSRGDICTNEIVQTALQMVLDNCSLESYASIRKRESEEKEAAAEERKAARVAKYPRQGKPWTLEEEQKLMTMHRQGYSVMRISNVLQRSPHAIMRHLERMP